MATVASYEDKNKVANMLIRDYELSRVWNNKEFSFRVVNSNSPERQNVLLSIW